MTEQFSVSSELAKGDVWRCATGVQITIDAIDKTETGWIYRWTTSVRPNTGITSDYGTLASRLRKAHRVSHG